MGSTWVNTVKYSRDRYDETKLIIILLTGHIGKRDKKKLILDTDLPRACKLDFFFQECEMNLRLFTKRSS